MFAFLCRLLNQVVHPFVSSLLFAALLSGALLVFATVPAHAAAPVDMYNDTSIPWASIDKETTTMPPDVCAQVLQAMPSLQGNPDACKATSTTKISVWLVMGTDGQLYPASSQVSPDSCGTGYRIYYHDYYDWFWPFELGQKVEFSYPGNCTAPRVAFTLCNDPANSRFPITGMNVSCYSYVQMGTETHAREGATIYVFPNGQMTFAQEIISNVYAHIWTCDWC